MERVTGIGGVFLRARDPVALAAWYREHLGLPIEPGKPYGTLTAAASGRPEQTVWSAFPPDTDYLGSPASSFMVNYRVDDLAAVLAALRAEGCTVEDKTEDSEFGKFGWVIDPEHNKVELWQPPPGM